MVIEKAKAHKHNVLEYKDHQASHGGTNSAPSYNNPLLSAHALSKRWPTVIMANIVANVANLRSEATALRMGKLATSARVLIISKLFVVPRLQPRQHRALTKARSHTRRDMVPWGATVAKAKEVATVNTRRRRRPRSHIPIKQTRVTTRHSDLREPQPSPSDSQPASSQPVSETTTSESSVSLPSSPSDSSSTESTSTSGNDSSSSETSSESSSQPSSNASSPETSSSASTSRSTSPELLEMKRSFNSLLAGTKDCQGHPVMRSQMDNLRDQQQRIAVLKQVASQPQNQPRPVSAPPVANMPLPPYP